MDIPAVACISLGVHLRGKIMVLIQPFTALSVVALLHSENQLLSWGVSHSWLGLGGREHFSLNASAAIRAFLDAGSTGQVANSPFHKQPIKLPPI